MAFTATDSYQVQNFFIKKHHDKIEIFFNSAKFSTQDFDNSYNFAKNLKEGLKSAKQESKPVMLIVHKSHCGACRILMPKLSTSDDMKKISDNFVMVNAFNGEDPDAKLYAPDGAYIPRFETFFCEFFKDVKGGYLS